MSNRTLTRAEVARFLGKSHTHIAYAIARGWLKPSHSTAMGTQLFDVEDVVAYAKLKEIELTQEAAALAS